MLCLVISVRDDLINWYQGHGPRVPSSSYWVLWVMARQGPKLLVGLRVLTVSWWKRRYLPTEKIRKKRSKKKDFSEKGRVPNLSTGRHRWVTEPETKVTHTEYRCLLAVVKGIKSLCIIFQYAQDNWFYFFHQKGKKKRKKKIIPLLLTMELCLC